MYLIIQKSLIVEWDFEIKFCGNYAEAMKYFAKFQANPDYKFIIIKTEVVTDWK